MKHLLILLTALTLAGCMTTEQQSAGTFTGPVRLSMGGLGYMLDNQYVDCATFVEGTRSYPKWWRDRMLKVNAKEMDCL